MKLLAIDTSNLTLGVSVCTEDKVLGEFTTNIRKNHSIRLMPMVAQVLEELDMETAELSAVAVAKGPGSYTGVRIGVVSAKSMAWALNLPLVGVSSLEVLAWNGANFPGLIFPLFDARRGQVYGGIYRWGSNGMETVENDRIILLRDALDSLKSMGEPVLFLGEDLQIHKETIEETMGTQAFFAPASYSLPRPAHLAMAAFRMLREGKTEDRERFTPSYLQLAEAEAKWLAGRQE
ncbi:MAG TPA: tRNA (adenosine(37)-N6)-threonylcarbamoyltransferase complex dimerization subunit type 1 TsaB [Paenibacillaceae bacterium]|nr:tRNA (adenosine(37)-N6)-threonylcarbamoyltransferase complex dimerization subunit type 1 TsaB [Paenibacillaceae bacterium]